MNNKKSLAVIGIGRWGKNLLREFDKIAKIDFCFHKGNPETKKWLAVNYPHIKIAGSYRELLANPTIDAIVIATPIKTHYALTRQALKAGKHVFVEKPMAESVGQENRLTELAQKQKKTLFVGYIYLYHPVFLKLKKLIKPEEIESVWCYWQKLGTFKEKIELDLLCHDISILKGLLGKIKKPKLIFRQGAISSADMVQYTGKSENKVPYSIVIDRAAPIKTKRVTIITGKGLYMWQDNQLLRFDKKSGGPKVIFEAKQPPLPIECKAFLAMLKQY